MNDSSSRRYPWQVARRPEIPIAESLVSGCVATNAESSVNELPSCEAEGNGTVSSDENMLTEFASSPTSPNDDLEELERSVIDMEKYVDELQFELLKFRQADEVKKTSTDQPFPPFEEFLKDLQTIVGSLEAHKTNYALVTDTQIENVRLREELLKFTNEKEQLRNQIDELKQIHENELKVLRTTNDEKMVSMRREYEEKWERQAKELNQLIEKEREDFATQREAWNEEKATLIVEHANELAAIMKTKEQKSAQEEGPDFRTEIMRQISEVQNQAQVQVAQLQSKIEQLLMKSKPPTGRSSGKRSSVGAQSSINQWPPQPSEISIQKLRKTPVNSAVIQPQAPDSTLSVGLKRAYFPHQQSTTEGTAEMVKSKTIKIAAVPPVLVMSEGSHPLLDNSSNSSEGKGCGDFVELPNSKWCKSSDLMASRQSVQPSYFQLASMNAQKIDVMPTDEWFDFTQSQAHFEGMEEPSQDQVPEDSQAYLPPRASMQTTKPILRPQQQQHLIQPTHQQTAFGSKKRHLFTVHSGNS
nr:conserved hypothetical protein [Hymenolepis microstoma]